MGAVRKPTPVQLVVEGHARSERLNETVQELVVSLRRQEGLDADLASRPANASERSAEVGLAGQILLSFFSAGAATALIACLQAYIQRDKSFKFRMKKADGSEMELEGRHFDPNAVKETVRAVEEFIR